MPPIKGATNVAADIAGSALTITVDLAQVAGSSKSGKSETIASSGGAKPLGGTGASLSLTVNLKGDKIQLPEDPKAFKTPEGMKNVIMGLEGSTMTLKVDLEKDFGLSSTGHTTIIASSSGTKPIPGTNAFFNLNLFSKGKPKLVTSEEDVVASGKEEGLRGVEVSVQGANCTFTIDLSNPIGPSKSGKAINLASSNGFASIPGTEASFNLIVCKSTKAKEEAIPEVPEADFPKGQKLKYSITGSTLTLKCNLAETAGKSSTGKSTIIAGTSGLKNIPNTPLSVNLNVFKSLDAKRPASGEDEAEPAAKRKKKAEAEDSS